MLNYYFSRKAVATFDNDEVQGQLVFDQKDYRAACIVSGTLKFKKRVNSMHGLHVYSHGDLGDSCSRLTSVLGMKSNSTKNLLGNLGNIEVKDDGTAEINVKSSSLQLYGANSIIGLGVGIHEQTDGLDHENYESLGQNKKIACASIAKLLYEPILLKNYLFSNHNRP
ncbi:Superoxide dismutase [Cu-Zn] [Thelohanellus kitauei]|uniref:Superoxide dismutase [Cu-Zn] n=1 Tax=Thelohanellus kitauei TaxID=669202 RepID=A0A0C2MGT6_THEKT|nr:Superoxide dismutase [Cu-Zn] [Thelohanellus kitauei]